MPRGISSTLTAQLNKAEIGGVFYLVDIGLTSGTQRIAEREIVYNSNTYSPGLISISGLNSNFEGSNDVSIEISNVTLDWSDLEQAESFFGAPITIYEYILSPDESTVADAYIKWKGFADEPSSITQERITVPGFSGTPTTRIEAPRRLVGPECSHTFANLTTTTTEITTALKSTQNFEGFGCPYRQSASIGFAGTLNANITSAATTLVIDMTAGDVTAGMIITKLDEIKIDSEVMLVTGITAVVSNAQTLTVTRAYRSTTAAAHTAAAVITFNNCTFSRAGCLARGMYGNNSADTFSGTKRNYFGGFPLVSGTIDVLPSTIPLIRHLQLKKNRVTLAGNESAYGQTIPLVYGRCQVAAPILLFVSDQGSFMTTGWIVAEGILATNGTNDTLSANPLDAYTQTGGLENIYINGVRRHDTRANFGIEAFLGTQDTTQPATSSFFASATVVDFDTNKLAFWGTAWVIIKTKKENNVSVDPSSGINGVMEVAFGRLVRVYSDASTFTRRATTNPAWVLLDYMTSKHAGGGIDYAKVAADTFKTVADYNATTVTSVIDGTTAVARWTFNGAIMEKKPYADYERLLCLAMYSTLPYIDINGKWAIRSMKSETLSGLPVFSSKSATNSERNIIWHGNHSSLTKSRQNIQNIPNQIKVNFNELDANGKWIPSQGVIEDRVTQRKIGTLSGDNSIRVVSKTIDLLGVITRDEAARIATLILRAGEFAQGGLENNLTVEFDTFYKTAADVSIGDVIEVQDDLLDSALSEQYFRVVDISDNPQVVGSGAGFVMIRTITATLHKNSIYDDGAGSLSSVTRLDGPVANDQLAPPVTSADMTEGGAFDNNNKLVTNLTFTYTEPSPLENFKDVVIMRSNLTNTALTYDAVTNPALDDWRLISTVSKTGNVIQNYEITGKWEVFTFLSRSLEGSIPSPTTKIADGSAFKYPRVSRLIDGMVDPIGIPANLQIFIGSNTVSLKWDAYTGTDLKLFKTYHIYRHTADVLGSATLIAEVDSNFFVDTSVAAATVYYYWVKGVSVLNVEGTATSSVNTTSPADAGTDTTVPQAPTIGTVQGYGSFNPNEYTWKVGIERPGGATNWNGVDRAELEIANDSGFTTFTAGKSLQRTDALGTAYQIKPPFTVDFTTNFPGTYYMRARVKNAFGFSSYTSTLTRKTNISDYLSADTTIPNAPDALAIKVAATATYLAGNQFEITFEIPPTQTASYWGYSVYVHDSATLPTATTQETGTAGQITAGSAVLTDTTKAWTVDTYAGKDLVIFHPGRGASPTFDYEGLMVLGKITSNTATTITFETPVDRLYRTHPNDTDASNCKYYIVNNNAGHHFWEKLRFSTPAIVNEGVVALTEERASRKRSLVFASNVTQLWTWVALYNLHGQGKVTASPVNATFAGIVSSEIGSSAITTVKINNLAITETKIDTDAVTTPKILALNVTAAKISVATLSAINADLGTITAGTVTGATLRTSSSTSRVEMNSTDGFIAVSGGSNVFQVTALGVVKASTIQPLTSSAVTYYGGTSGGLVLASIPSGSQAILGLTAAGNADVSVPTGGAFTVAINAVNIITLNASGIASTVALTGAGGVNTSGNIETSGAYRMDAADVISTAATFVGGGGVNVGVATIRGDRYILNGNGANGISFDAGTGMVIGDTATWTALRFYAGNASEQMKIDLNESSTQSAMLLRGDGSLRRVSIDNSDFGTGAKRYLYLA